MRLPFKETLMTCVCVGILCALGTWQVQRLHWKNEIIARIEQAYSKGERRTLTEGLLQRVDDGTDLFNYGVVRGHLLKDKAVLVGPRMVDGRSGYHLLIPVEMHGVQKPLIVNSGWVSDLWNDTMEERLAILPSDVTVRGLVRHPDFSSFTSKNSPANELWFRPDPLDIAKAKNIPDIYRTILYADYIDPPLQDVTPQEEKWLPRNKHLQYAIFWYAMAAAMLGVYGFYIHSRKSAGNYPAA